MDSREYQSVIDKIYRFKHLGVSVAEKTGAVLIGKAPYIAPMAVLNSLYPPISMADIERIEKKINIPIPHAYRFFLTHISNI